MSGTPDQPPDPALDREAFLDNKTKVLTAMAETLLSSTRKLQEITEARGDNLKQIADQIMPTIERMHASIASANDFTKKTHEMQKDFLLELTKLRALTLGKIDGLQGTMDLLRQDVRNSWQTADFAINNSRNMRDEVEQLQTLISTMQKQYQLLASQVEVLRRSADEKE